MKSKWAVNGFGNTGSISNIVYLRKSNTFIKEMNMYRYKNDLQRQNLIDCFHWLDNAFYIYYTVPKIIRRSYEESIRFLSN
jgi:hypothetical protein